MSEQISLLRKLCIHHTNLDMQDIAFLENMAGQLTFIAELTGTDIFIDALSSNDIDAIVLAWAHPGNRSLYSDSVVGQMAYAIREPAVYQAFYTAGIVRNVRGVSQEGVPIEQTVVPLRNENNKVIGVLIMERDISAEIRQEEQVEFLSQTADHLSNTLMSLSMTGFAWEEWLGNGIFVVNHKGQITYANKNAIRIYGELGGESTLGSDLAAALSFSSLTDMLEGLKEPVDFRFGDTRYLVQAHPLLTSGEVSGCVVSLQDVRELRQKEHELNVQSAIIREIHHRVKNNLQNVVSLLRLQMRRSESAIIQAEFTACVNRILSIAGVHDAFAYQRWDSINLQDLAEYVLSKAVESFAPAEQKIKTAVQGQAVMIPASQAVPLALVINELVTNSLKHGIKDLPDGEISIFIEESEDLVHLMVADSGAELDISLRQGQDRINQSHLGLYIVKLLICEQLGGKFQLERRGGATVANISFSLCSTKEKLSGPAPY